MTVRVDEAAGEVVRAALQVQVGTWAADFVRASRGEHPAQRVRHKLARFRLRGLSHEQATVRAACALVDADPVVVVGRLHEALVRSMDDIIESQPPGQTPGVVIDLVTVEWPRYVARYAQELVHISTNGGAHA